MISFFWKAKLPLAIFFYFYILVFLLAFPSFAAISPILSEPINNAQISQNSSPKLTWQPQENCPADTNISCFRVEVADSESFNPANKSTYTNNTYYSPQGLSLGKWYWRVKAKDISNNWSNFSEIFAFEITNQELVSATSPSPSPSTLTSTKSSFSISSQKSTLNSNEQFSLSVNLNNFDPNASYYLKGAFLKSGETNYFGKTFTSNSWIKNNETYSKQLKIQTDGSGNFSGNLEIMADQDDSGYQGSGNYILKVARYNSSGSGPSWSNELTVYINNVALPTVNPTASIKTTSSLKSPSPSLSIKINPDVLGTSTSSSTMSADYKIPDYSSDSSKLAEDSENSDTKVLNKKQVNWFLVLGGVVFLIVSIGFLVKLIMDKLNNPQER